MTKFNLKNFKKKVETAFFSHKKMCIAYKLADHNYDSTAPRDHKSAISAILF